MSYINQRNGEMEEKTEGSESKDLEKKGYVMM